MTKAIRPSAITCAHCGTEKKVGRSGPIPTYCSGSCRAAVKYERSREDGRYEEVLATERRRTIERQASAARPCPYCATPMTHPRRVQCGSEPCKLQHAATRMKQWQRDRKDATGQWNHRRYAEQQQEYSKRRREQLGHWRKLYPEAAALADARRRMLIQQADRGERFAPADVYERDDWTCGLCQLPVDPGLAWPHPMSASVDHILPLSQGGSHTLANVQCAHLSCNSRKSDRVDVEVIGEPSAGGAVGPASPVRPVE